MQLKLVFFSLLALLIRQAEPTCDTSSFIDQVSTANNGLKSANSKSLQFLLDQKSVVAKLISLHHLDTVTEMADTISYVKSMDSRGFKRLNRNQQMPKDCWLHKFYQLNSLQSTCFDSISNCTAESFDSITALTDTYFYTMVNEMLYQSAVGSSSALYVLGQYNVLTEHWKILQSLEGTLKYSEDGWSGTQEIVGNEVKQIKNGAIATFEKLEECQSVMVQKFLNVKTDVSQHLKSC